MNESEALDLHDAIDAHHALNCDCGGPVILNELRKLAMDLRGLLTSAATDLEALAEWDGVGKTRLLEIARKLREGANHA